MSDYPRSLLEFQQRFPDERACADYLIETRWPDGFICPNCGSARAWALETKAFTFECAGCHKQTSVTAGTIMHGSKLSLTIWFWAAYLMASHSNGISALQLQKQLGLGSYKSAWFLAAKLRLAMVAPGRLPLQGLVEADETHLSLPFERGSHHRWRWPQRPRQASDRRRGRGRRRPARTHPARQDQELLRDHPARLPHRQPRQGCHRQDRRLGCLSRRQGHQA